MNRFTTDQQEVIRESFTAYHHERNISDEQFTLDQERAKSVADTGMSMQMNPRAAAYHHARVQYELRNDQLAIGLLQSLAAEGIVALLPGSCH